MYRIITKKRYVFKHLNKFPNATTKDLYERFPSYDKGMLRAYLKQYRDIYSHMKVKLDDVYVMHKVMLNKMTKTIQLSIEELEAIRRVEKVVEKEFGDE